MATVSLGVRLREKGFFTFHGKHFFAVPSLSILPMIDFIIRETIWGSGERQIFHEKKMTGLLLQG